MPSKTRKTGLWLVGACGGVGATVALGVAALAKKRTETIGLVSERPEFRSVPLDDPARFAFGGHEIRSETLLSAIDGLHVRSGLFDDRLIRDCALPLRAFQKEIRPGTTLGASRVVSAMADRKEADGDKSALEAVERLSADMTSFRQRRGLDRVIVIHVASSEPPMPRSTACSTWRSLRPVLGRRGKCALSSSSIYALAAVEAGCPYINFTPSPGIAVPAIRERAHELGLPYMGSDGKTGETLVKSVLAPMFAMRHLEVMSWVGQNVLGNRDGAVLDDPKTKQSKLRTKDRVVPRIVGGSPHTRVGIDFVPSLDDWKVAWDFIHFRGFLGTKMSMQFTWQGSDSILAAPLVIDLARFAAWEHRRSAVGPMRHLAFFFKDPMDVDEHDLTSQWKRLVEHVVENGL